MKLLTHLFINECELAPGTEWKDSSPGWKIILISKGFFYWIARSEIRDFGAGDVLVVGPSVDGVLRASQISPASLHFFYFRPEHLVGLMSLSERLSLEAFAQTAQTRIIPAADPVAQEFVGLVQNTSRKRSFFYRCRILHLVAMIFGDALPGTPQPRGNVATTLLRFEEIIARIPDADLINYTSEKLAEMCGCSLRHFRRMFHKQFKTSIRAKQTELRLEKARQLLGETDEKIITVAYESGYRHLGFFNSMFKKKFGVTPSEWRRLNASPERSSRKSRRLNITVIGFSLLLAGASALPAGEPAPPADKPSGAKATPGAVTNAPAARGTNAPTFEVRGYEVQGNTLLSQDTLEKIFVDYVGKAITLDQIRSALGELQLAYRGRGYVTVAVGLPQQQLTNGVVKVRVTEAKLAEIEVVGNRWFSSNNVMKALPSLRTNQLLNNLVLQQELDAANQNRDRQIYPVIGPGPEPGTSALTLKVKERFPMHGRIDLNNVSTPTTPELRINTALQYNNLWQLDHEIGAQYSFSPGEFKSDTGWEIFNRPLVANYSLFYRVPIDDGDYAYRQDHEYGIGDFGYNEVSRKFQAPGLSGRSELVIFAAHSDTDTGVQLGPRELITQTAIAKFESQASGQDSTITDDVGIRASKPMPARWGINWSVNAGADWKNYRFTSNNTNTFFTTITITNNGQPEIISSQAAFAQPTINQALQYAPLSFGFQAARADDWGNTSFNLNNSFNFVESVDHGFQIVAYSKEASPTYFIAAPSLTRDFNLPGEFQLHLHADGQWASGPLINNEQFGNGGISLVRGYRDGQIYSDSGWHGTIEPRTPAINLGLVNGTEPMYVRFSVFTDYGQSFYSRQGAPHYNLWGVGTGLNATIGTHLDMRLSWAIALLSVPGWPADKGRLNFSLACQF